jgi:hypothetical protein
MGDSLQLQNLMSLPAGGADSCGIGGVEVADELFAQMDGPMCFSDGFQPDRLADKSTANKTQASVPFDMSPVAHAPPFPLRRIFQGRQDFGINPPARPIQCRWRAPSQGFMRTLNVVLFEPAIGTLLCPRPGQAARRDHFPLNAPRQTESAVAAALCRRCPKWRSYFTCIAARIRRQGP